MSKASRAKNKERRKKEKFARKRAKKALYEKYAKEGRSKESKRFKRKTKRKGPTGVSHPLGQPCGNPACIRCYGISFEAFLRKGKPFRMPHWMYLLWIGDSTRNLVLRGTY